jgi:hypothetical protein
MAAASYGITIVKTFTYRGQAEEWSNTYWLEGTPPATQAEALAMARDLAEHEQPLYLGTVTVVRAYVYAGTELHRPADFVIDPLQHADNTAIVGTAVTGTGTYPAGDQAAWIRWKTSLRTEKGKPVYLRKYFHGVPTDEDSPATSDNVSPSWAAAATAFGNSLAAGPVGGGKIADRFRDGDPLLSNSHSTFMTVRTLKRRGKRPLAPAP